MFALIKSEFNKSIILKSVIIACIATMLSMLLQLLKQQIYFYKSPPISVFFFAGVCLLFFSIGFLFSLCFFMFRRAIPGSTGYKKGLLFALLINLTVYLPGIVGGIALDGQGSFNLFTPYKIDIYLTAIADFISISSIGVIAGLIVKTKSIQQGNIQKTNKTHLVLACILGAVLFSPAGTVLFYIATQLFPFVLNIHEDNRLWFHMGLFIPLMITDAVLPVFYSVLSKKLTGTWVNKGLCFLIVFILFRIICTSFVLPLGEGIEVVLFYLGVTIVPISSIVFLSARLLVLSKKKLVTDGYIPQTNPQ